MHFSFMEPIGLKLVLLAAGSFLFLWPQTAPPDLPPSYEVHISPSTTRGKSSSGGPRYSVNRGFDLKTMIATVYEIDPSRVVLPDALNDGKPYDFVLVLPVEESRDAVNRLIQESIKKHFHLTVNFEARSVDTYVLTAPKGANPSMKSSTGDSYTSLGQTSLRLESKAGVKDANTVPPGTSITGINASDSTMEEFCNVLASGLDRPVINETRLEEKYDVEVRGDAHTTDEFLQALREQFGLVLTPHRRKVKMLIVRPA